MYVFRNLLLASYFKISLHVHSCIIVQALIDFSRKISGTGLKSMVNASSEEDTGDEYDPFGGVYLGPAESGKKKDSTVEKNM